MGNKITFNGTPDGDGECFCWDVTEEQYEKICGREAHKRELELRYNMCEQFDIQELKWHIYPQDLLANLVGNNYNKKMQMSIEVKLDID